MHFSIDVETTYILIFWSGFFDGCFIIGRSLGLSSQWSQRQRCERGKVWFDSLSRWPSSSPRAIPCPGAHCQAAVSFHLQRDISVTATDLRDLWVCMWCLLQPDWFVNCWLGGGLRSTWRKWKRWGKKWGHSKVRCPEFTSSLVGWSGLRVIAEPRFKGTAKRKEGRRWWDVNLDQALCWLLCKCYQE